MIPPLYIAAHLVAGHAARRMRHAADAVQWWATQAGLALAERVYAGAARLDGGCEVCGAPQGAALCEACGAVVGGDA